MPQPLLLERGIRSPLNIACRLLNREVHGAPAGSMVGLNRQLCTSLPPTDLVCEVEAPDCYIGKYLPSGQLLVCFSSTLQEVELYRHVGIGTATHGETDPAQPPRLVNQWHRHFRLVHRIRVTHLSQPESVCREFCLALHREQFVLVAKVSPQLPFDPAAPPAPVQGIPVVAETTLVLIRVSDGTVADAYTIQDDFVHLNHSNAPHLFEDRLVILGVRSQTLHLLQVLPSGRFALVQRLGKWCHEDDELLVSIARDQERRWREAQPQAPAPIDVPQGRTQPAEPHQARPAEPHQARPANVQARAAGHRPTAATQDTAPARVPAGRPGQPDAALAPTVQTRGGLQEGHAQAQAAARQQPAPGIILADQQQQPQPPLPRTAVPAPYPPPGHQQHNHQQSPPHPPGLHPTNHQVQHPNRAQAWAQGALQQAPTPLGPIRTGAQLVPEGDEGPAGGGRVPRHLLRRAGTAADTVTAPQHAPSQPSLLRATSSQLLSDDHPLGLIEGIRHKLLVFLFKQQQQRQQDGQPDALQNFCFHFDGYLHLVMWKVQLLERHTLLLSFGMPDAATSRSSDASQQKAFFVLYDVQSRAVIDFIPNTSEEFMKHYLALPNTFHAGSQSSDWERYITPPDSCLYNRDLLQRQLGQHWGSQQGTRRVLANVPVAAQSLSSSPFLDASIFHFDEKLISCLLRPRPFGDHSLRFVARSHPDNARFKLFCEPFDTPLQHGARPPVKQLITYHFHPIEPFVLAFLQTFVAGNRICICMRT